MVKKMELNKGKLYIVGTPIGNLGDITLRAIETLKKCDLILAEDTRQTLKLLNHLEIKKKLISYHRHNEDTKSFILIDLLLPTNCHIATYTGDFCYIIVTNASRQMGLLGVTTSNH